VLAAADVVTALLPPFPPVVAVAFEVAWESPAAPVPPVATVVIAVVPPDPGEVPWLGPAAPGFESLQPVKPMLNAKIADQ
jgi:hypothetical protein